MKKDLYQEQINIEKNIRDTTVDRFEKLTNQNIKQNLESHNAYGLVLMKRAIEPMAKAIRHKIKISEKGTAGVKASCVARLKLFNPEELAYLVTRTIVNCLSDKTMKYNATAIHIGTEAENDFMIRTFKEENPRFFKYELNDTKDTNSRGRRFGQIKAAYKRWLKKNNNSWNTWVTKGKDDPNSKEHFGSAMIVMFMEATGIVEKRVVWHNKTYSESYLIPTKKVTEFIADSLDFVQMIKPMYQPMVVKPLAWTDSMAGGYLSVDIPDLPFMKTDAKNLNKLRSVSHNLEKAFTATNHLQNTAWKINEFVLDTFTKLKDLDLAIAGLPPFEELPEPISPLRKGQKADTLTPSEEEEFKKWKKDKKEHIEQEIKYRSKRVLCAKIEQTAKDFKDYEEIFFPKNLDFRGRIYDAPLHINPEGNSLAKGLLKFSHGEPIAKEEYIIELAVHGANCYGEDKLGFTGRYEWVLENQERILEVAEDPIGNLWWAKEADCPWTFLAFCEEWHGVAHNNYDHITHIAVQKDATCSGLQHFSGALKDEIGAEEVNLTGSDKPADIYQTVADKTIEKVKADLNDSDKAEMAQRWLDYEITRKTCKRATMTRVYGSTQYSSRKFVTEYINETDLKRLENDPNYVSLFKDKEVEFKASLYLASHIWESINETVLAAPKAMNWLQTCAQILAKENLPVEWTTLDGLPIKQEYPCYRRKRIKTVMNDTLIYLTKREPKKTDDDRVKLNSRKQANGISPNWVHGNDACHLRMTVNLAHSEGVKNFSFIHDSFGTLATQVGKLAWCLRETFIQLYQNHDTLDLFRQDLQSTLDKHGIDAELPPVPQMGNLDLSKVHESDYFFN